ncbi:guanine nucleotide-binding protein alpha-2 subunit-like [Ruditapes philippinarum]|uniref:guanine nucleotide-binding protein alpha-2 subunit-like n=1 Tax=Ruditapes philippinarum TaxID=129788 RepID=UPI00295BCDE0|nr:guanine nucleotide-binding protein alpha-2 subunit-like [Ruditapes philippinarum]
MGCVESHRRSRSAERSRQLTEELTRDFMLKRQEINVLTVGTKYSDKEQFIQQLLRFIKEEQENNDATNNAGGPQEIVISKNLSEICFTICDRKFRILHLEDGVEAFKSKWINCLDHVSVILVVSNLSKYNIHSSDKSPEENQLLDSINLCEEVGRHYSFRDIPICLLFMNPDVFEQKLSQISLSIYFPNFKGAGSFEEALAFILTEFEKSCTWKSRSIHTKVLQYNDSADLSSLIQTVIDMCPIEEVHTERYNRPYQSSFCDEPLSTICILPLWYCVYYCCMPTRSRLSFHIDFIIKLFHG